MKTKVFTIIIFVAVLCTSSLSQGARKVALITQEMLTNLRAPEEVIVTAPTVMELQGMMGISWAHPTEAVSIKDVVDALEESFDILISYESHPISKTIRFSHKILANERLIDALDNLTKATSGFSQWRMLDGRIVISESPVPGMEGSAALGDRFIDAKIEAETLYEALLQVEDAYTAEYDDAPLSIVFMEYEVAHLPAEKGRFYIHRKGSLRSIMVELLSQLPTKNTKYRIGRGVLPPKYQFPDSVYAAHPFYYSVAIAVPEITDARTDIEGAETSLWIESVAGPEADRRFRRYFERLYPELVPIASDAEEAREK